MADDHYDASVNRGDLNMRSFRDELNDRWNDGWKLSHIFEQGGNTIVIWERRAG